MHILISSPGHDSFGRVSQILARVGEREYAVDVAREPGDEGEREEGEETPAEGRRVGSRKRECNLRTELLLDEFSSNCCFCAGLFRSKRLDTLFHVEGRMNNAPLGGNCRIRGEGDGSS